ncbi:hypothetical protein WG66_004538 [Moniliophthora roreri]|nr:hypothetical protein WG66_004538 [Moniliophthora roreri]
MASNNTVLRCVRDINLLRLPFQGDESEIRRSLSATTTREPIGPQIASATEPHFRDVRELFSTRNTPRARQEALSTMVIRDEIGKLGNFLPESGQPNRTRGLKWKRSLAMATRSRDNEETLHYLLKASPGTLKKFATTVRDHILGDSEAKIFVFDQEIVTWVPLLAYELGDRPVKPFIPSRVEGQVAEIRVLRPGKINI